MTAPTLAKPIKPVFLVKSKRRLGFVTLSLSYPLSLPRSHLVGGVATTEGYRGDTTEAGGGQGCNEGNGDSDAYSGNSDGR